MTMESKILDAINIAKKDAVSIELGSLDMGYDYEVHPYDKLERLLHQYLKVVEVLKKHNHEFSDDCYCMICGIDGRA